MKLQLRGKYWDKILFLQDWLSIPWALIMDLFQNTCVPINEKLPVRKHEKKIIKVVTIILQDTGSKLYAKNKYTSSIN